MSECKLQQFAVNLNSEHAGLRVHFAAALEQLDRGYWAGAVPEVDHDRALGFSKHRLSGQVAVNAAQSIGVGSTPSRTSNWFLCRHAFQLTARFVSGFGTALDN